MCEFCIKHGEGRKWYENITNYTEEMFHQVSSEEKLKAYLKNFFHSLSIDVQRAYTWKKRLPRIYRLLVYPLVTRHLKKTHFGQIVPVEDIENILDNFTSVVRLPCICRKVTTGENKRYCFGIGMDLTPIFKDIPDFSDFDRLSSKEAKQYIRHLDTEGQTHSVWTFNTPFISTLCNCDRDCMAYRFQLKMQIGKAMWKGEYIAGIDPLLCNGCKECLKRCYFDAITYDRQNAKCSVQLMNCYGCGICRAVCKNNAVRLMNRSSVLQEAHDW
ncbi:MAG: 4Fe-4S ferredoxin [Thermodesulfobacteriota bacterium]